MIEKADLTDNAVNQIAEIIKEPIKARDKEIEILNKRNKEIYEGFIATTEELCEATKEIERLKKELQEEKEEKEHYQAIVESWE